jgi:hypothetical protein
VARRSRILITVIALHRLPVGVAMCLSLSFLAALPHYSERPARVPVQATLPRPWPAGFLDQDPICLRIDPGRKFPRSPKTHVPPGAISGWMSRKIVSAGNTPDLSKNSVGEK